MHSWRESKLLDYSRPSVAVNFVSYHAQLERKLLDYSRPSVAVDFVSYHAQLERIKGVGLQ